MDKSVRKYTLKQDGKEYKFELGEVTLKEGQTLPDEDDENGILIKFSRVEFQFCGTLRLELLPFLNRMMDRFTPEEVMFVEKVCNDLSNLAADVADIYERACEILPK
jgi:hypothetical protein